MDARLPCLTPGCTNTILQGTAARTGGICRPCEQRLAGERHEAYVRANRREIDLYEGVTDPVELVRIRATPRPYDELVIEKPFPGDLGDFFGSLAKSDIDRLQSLAVSCMPDRKEEAEQIALWLAAFTTADLFDIQSAFANAGWIQPGIVFRRASPTVRDRVSDFLGADVLPSNHALTALAWIGDEDVVNLFAQWRMHPPKWAAELFVNPAEYSFEAGWELDPANRKRELYLPVGFALVPLPSPQSESPVELAKPAHGQCEWCKGPLSTLLRINTGDQRFGGLRLPPTVVTCALCTCFGPLFMRVDRLGVATWHEANVEAAYRPDESGELLVAEIPLTLGRRRNPLHAAHPFLPTATSQIGGAPGWLQDAEYPKCPDCHQTMPCIAQVSHDELQHSAEGVIYAFWCDSCQVTATGYQQT